jgi:hypothetical protein
VLTADRFVTKMKIQNSADVERQMHELHPLLEQETNRIKFEKFLQNSASKVAPTVVFERPSLAS